MLQNCLNNSNFLNSLVFTGWLSCTISTVLFVGLLLCRLQESFDLKWSWCLLDLTQQLVILRHSVDIKSARSVCITIFCLVALYEKPLPTQCNISDFNALRCVLSAWSNPTQLDSGDHSDQVVFIAWSNPTQLDSRGQPDQVEFGAVITCTIQHNCTQLKQLDPTGHSGLAESDRIESGAEDLLLLSAI